MLYSSGTTGRPKGVLRPLPERPPADPLPLIAVAASNLWRFREGQVYLSPAPLYHSAPQAAVSVTIRRGGTVIVMEQFDPERFLAARRAIPRHPHAAGADDVLAHAEAAGGRCAGATISRRSRSRVHAAAPCPIPVKRTMIEWWGPIILEYYAATEGHGLLALRQRRWLAHPGTVGKSLLRRAAHPRRRDARTSGSARPASSGSRPLRRSNISTIRRRRPRRTPPTAR